MFRRRSRERREWIGTTLVTPRVVAVNALDSVDLLSPATLEEWPGGRLARVIGQMFISPATAPAAASGYGVFVGLVVEGTATFGGGSSAAWDPELDQDFGWIWWQSVFPQIGGTGAADSNASRWIGYFRLDIHERLRKRFAATDKLAIKVKNSNSSAASVQYSYSFRWQIAAGRR